MRIERVRIPAIPLIQINKILGDIVVERKNRHILVDEDFFGIHHDLIALAAAVYARLGHELIIFRVRIQTIVLCTTSNPHIEEGGRIEVVAYPASARHVEVV